IDVAVSAGAALGRAVKTVKEQLRRIPDNGLGYGLLRYLNDETGAQLANHRAPQLGFNYLGRFAAPSEADWAPAEEGSRLRGGADAAMPLSHVVAVNALTLDGSDGATLTANWSWAPALIDEAAVRDLADTWFAVLGALVRHVTQPGAGGRTPSDVALACLAQDEIERLESRYYPIEGILRLSPLQHG